MNVYKQTVDYGVKTNHFIGVLVDSLHSHALKPANQCCCFIVLMPAVLRKFARFSLNSMAANSAKQPKLLAFIKPAESGKSPDSSDSKPTDSETSQVQGSNKDSKTAPVKRKLKRECFKGFPWLCHDSNRNILFCDYCIDAGRENVFTKGKSALFPKKDDIVKHKTSTDHKFAVTVHNSKDAGLLVSG